MNIQRIAVALSEFFTKSLGSTKRVSASFDLAFLTVILLLSQNSHQRAFGSDLVNGSLASDSLNRQLYHLAKIENDRDENDSFLQKALLSPNAAIASKAAYVSAGMPDVMPLEVLEVALKSPHAKVRLAVSFAISKQIKNPDDAKHALMNALAKETEIEVKALQLEVLGRLVQAEDLDVFFQVIQNSLSSLIEVRGAALGLSLFFRTERLERKPDVPTSLSPDQQEELIGFLELLANTNSEGAAGTSELLAQALSAARPKLDVAQLNRILQLMNVKPQAESTRRLIGILSRLPSEDTNGTPILGHLALKSESSRVRLDAIAALSKQKISEQTLSVFRAVILKARPNEKIAAMRAIEGSPDIKTYLLPLELTIEQLANAGIGAEKSAALSLLVAAKSANAGTLLQRSLASTDVFVLVNSIGLLEKIEVANDESLISTFLTHKSPLVRVAALSLMASWGPEKLTNSGRYKAVVSEFLQADDERTICAGALFVGGQKLVEFDVKLKALVMFSPKPFARQCALEALDKLGIEKYIAEAEYLLSYPVIPVAQKAFEILETSGRVPSKTLLPRYNGFVKVMPSCEEVVEALQNKVIFETTQGAITLILDPGAPLFATNLVALVRQGYYNQNRIFRVEPSFVLQFGDPLGDGNSSLGYLMRDEFSAKTHRRGTVGVATFGHDGGDGQIFFNTTNNYGLNGSYTVLGKIVDGLELLGRFTSDDVILSARLEPAQN